MAGSAAVREQRLVFGEDPELYDRARAGYSDQVVDAVLDFAGIGTGAGRQALEVGAGTGKATVAFAARGLGILALEPDPAMAAVARRNCRSFPAVRFETIGFEDWPGQPAGFDLLVSAQAWHWVDPQVRAARAAESLVDGGTIALLWHRVAWSGEPLRGELDDIYRRMVPALRAANPGFPGLDPRDDDGELLAEISGSGRFEDVTQRFVPWPAEFSADGLTDLLLSQSNHRLLPDGRRTALIAAVRDLVERHGGTVTVPHDTWVVLARRRSR